ncbi:MAG: tetratricopeptide repeat protein [Paramuribaculum sp.]|nr:tetratricopeptide repeat protein [Paramuribaculum sp.]
MANDNQNQNLQAQEEQVEKTTGLINQIQKGQKAIMWSIIVLAIIVCVILIYIYAIRKPAIQAADDAIGQADITMTTGNDSTALHQYKQVADNYGYDAGNRAALNAAILLYRDGKYEEAIKYLKKYKATESIIGASSKSLEGDCYVNLKQLDKALDCFKQAIKLSDENPAYTPLFMLKAATVLREKGDYKAEAEMYKDIEKDYPTYAAQTGIEIQKYIKRAELQSEQAK